MNNSKLIGILRSFTSKEMREFEHYLHSSFFNSDEKVIQLFNYLRKGILHSSALEKKDVLDKSFLSNKLFPGKKYDPKKIPYLLTDLTRHTENYAINKALEKDQDLQLILLAKEMAARDCKKAYNNTYDKSTDKAKSSTVKDADFYYYQFLAEHNHLGYAIAKQQRKEKSNIEVVVENLDKFYLARKLQLCCEIFNVQNVLSSNYRIFLLEEILSHLREHSYQDTPIIGIYYQILKTLTEPSLEEHFIKLKKLLLEHEAVLSSSELLEAYQYAINYCIKKINLGNINYQKTLFDIYKIQLNKKVMLVDNSFSQWDFKNMVSISLRLREHAWASNFIHEYKKYLTDSERENAFVYNLSYLHFHKKEYSKSLSLLQKVDFTDIYYQLDTRAIMLKIYYELNDTDAFFYHVTAFKIFLKRNKVISDYQRTIYKNLVKFTSKLVRTGSAKRKIITLKHEVEQIKQVADIQWLLQKIEELI